MSVTVKQPRPRLRVPAAAALLRAPLWQSVAASRLLVLFSGILSAAVQARGAGWQRVDTSRSTLHLGALGNLLAGPVDRWDAVHYLHIAQHGYTTAMNTSFYPLYPMLIHLLAPLTLGSYAVAGVLISVCSYAAALLLLHQLTLEEFGSESARATVLLLTFAPMSFFFTAIYTESLFLALSVGAFYAARHGRWGTAAMLAAAGTATRVPGILVIAGLAYMWWRTDTRPRQALVWLALATLPLLGYTLYLDLHGFGLLASVHNESQYGRVMRGPILTILNAVWDTLHSVIRLVQGKAVAGGSGMPLPAPEFDLIELTVLGISVAALVEAWRRLPKEYAIYCALTLIVCLSDSYPLTPLKTFDRFALTMFPLWMIAGRWAAQKRLLPAILAVELVALAFYTYQFASWTFVA